MRFRYDEFANERLFYQFGMREGKAGWGGPRGRTPAGTCATVLCFTSKEFRPPLLIIQGDLDFVAIQQGEQFFTALHRQGKRARFARYWGEDHVFQSPANVRDMWQQIYAWLDEHLRAQK